MKIKKNIKKKLELDKIKIYSLSRNEQKGIYGGNNTDPVGTPTTQETGVATVSCYSCASGINGCATVTC